jgi:hypothetical protein
MMREHDGAVVQIGTVATAYDPFLSDYPAYHSTHVLDTLRAREFAHLDDLQHVYLDYTGADLYGDGQLREYTALLQSAVLGNPHSVNPTSQAATQLVERAREAVLAYFNAPRELYELVFTSNASGALKLVGEAYPFAPGCEYLLTFDNHNLVNGIREFAWQKGATVTYVPVVAPELRVDERELLARLVNTESSEPRLFACPAQSNFSGVQHPLRWIAQAQVTRVARATERSRLRAHQPARPEPVASRLRCLLLLQDVRLSHRDRLPYRAPHLARGTATTVVRGRHDQYRLRARARLALPPAQRARL